MPPSPPPTQSAKDPLRAARSGFIVHVDVDGPVRDVVIPADATDVLAIVHQDGSIIGQTWLPASERLTAQELRQALALHETAARRHRARKVLTRVLGKPAPASSTSAVSVVVCTMNRPDQLRDCLTSLLALNRAVELLVVDNGSSDDATTRLCSELGVRCVLEPRGGQTVARNRGIAETAGDLIAFTDDDVAVQPDWLDDIDGDFADPLTMIATGYIGPRELRHDAQVQFEAHGGFERHSDPRLFSAATTGVIGGAASAGAGANLVVRRDLFSLIGGFDEAFGAGTPTRASDDKVLFYRTLEAGFRIRYSPSRIVWHQHRRDHASLLRTMRDYGTGEFTWTAHVLRTRNDAGALSIWRWWLGHFAINVWRWHRGGPRGVSLRITREEIRGALGAPRALRSLPKAKVDAPVARQVGLRAPAFVPDAAPVATVAGPAPELPRITVAIASYNRRESLAGVLDHLNRQDLPSDAFDVVVVLDGSTDGSAEMASSFEARYELTVVEQPNRGLASARNAGAKAATHPIVLFLDDDIEPLPDLVAAHAAAHAAAPEPTWVLGYFPPLLGTSWIEQEVRAWWSDHFRFKAESGHRWTMTDFADGNSSMPVALLEELGWFDEDFFGGRRQDHDLGLRFLSTGRLPVYAANAVGDHRPTVDVSTSLANAYAEGRYDVLMASKHPEAARQQPLGRAVIDRRGWFRVVISEQLGLARSVAIAGRLEAAGLRSLWTTFLGIAWTGRYQAGIRDGLLSAALVRLPAPPPPVEIHIALDGKEHQLPEQVGAADLVFEQAGREVARVPAVVPGAQWSWDDIIERSVNAVAPAPAFAATPRDP